jgi:hypothetical protein
MTDKLTESSSQDFQLEYQYVLAILIDIAVSGKTAEECYELARATLDDLGVSEYDD